MVNKPAIINFLIIGIAALMVPFLISSVYDYDLVPVLVMLGLLTIIIAFFFLKEQLSMWPLIATSMLLNLNFLPFPLAPFQVFFILLILYYVTGYVAIRQAPFTFGWRTLLIPIIGITVICVYHNPTVGLKV